MEGGGEGVKQILFLTKNVCRMYEMQKANVLCVDHQFSFFLVNSLHENVKAVQQTR